MQPPDGRFTPISCSVIPNGPSNVANVLNGMRETHDSWEHTFFDRLGRSISVPRNPMNHNREYFDDGYAKALWDYRNGDMLLGEDNHTIYVRDVDDTGANQRLDTWHAVGSLEDEYHVRPTKAYRPWNTQLRVECSKLPHRVRRGVKFANLAFRRVDGTITRVHPSDPMFQEPYEVTMPTRFDLQLMEQAAGFLRFVTDDEHSAQNLARMFATPMLEPYKHLFYVLHGAGGNGKGILLNALRQSFPGLSKSVDVRTLLGGARGGGGFATDQETLKLIGTLWAYDEDADTITLEQATVLKRIGTGDTMTGRRIQENSVSFRNRATLIIASNNEVVLANTEALRRRRVFVRMKDGHTPDQFTELIRFCAEYGAAPFLMASCALWERSDLPWDDVEIGSPLALSEHEQWYVDQIVMDGYAVSGANPYYANSVNHRNAISKLGLRSTQRRIEGRNTRVLVVQDEQRFSVYRKASAQAAAEAEQEAERTVTPPPAPRKDQPSPLPGDYGLAVNYATVTAGKRSYDWQKVKNLPAGSTSRPDTSAYAVIPCAGTMILDLDAPKDNHGTILTDAPTGWELISREVGPYGSPRFPRTYLVSTPTGSKHGVPTVHAYYRIPTELQGQIKNGAHLGGVPVDVRCETKGYVIGAGSVLDDGGTYQLLDLPQDQAPILSDAMIVWLKNHGYITGHPAIIRADGTRPTLANVMYRSTRMAGKSMRGQPDMTPIPAGSRNTGLHAWAYGRLINHPQDADRIHDDLYARGQASGLDEHEITTIWNSIQRQLKATP